jgi:hypothetical protein
VEKNAHLYRFRVRKISIPHSDTTVLHPVQGSAFNQVIGKVLVSLRTSTIDHRVANQRATATRKPLLFTDLTDDFIDEKPRNPGDII